MSTIISLIEEAKNVLSKIIKEIEFSQGNRTIDIIAKANDIFSECHINFQNLTLYGPSRRLSILFEKKKTILIAKNKSINIKCYSPEDVAIAICIIWIGDYTADCDWSEERELLNILLDYNKWVVLVENNFRKHSNDVMECQVNLTGHYNLMDILSSKYRGSMRFRRYLIFRQNSQTIIYDLKKNQTACAKCSKWDTYNPTLGILIAWSRLKNIHIPDGIFNVMYSDDLKHNDIFTYFGETEQQLVIATVFGRKTVCVDDNTGCCLTRPIPQMKPLTLGRKVKLIMRNGVKIC